MASRATRRPTTRLVGSTSAIVSAGTRRRWRERKPLFTERASGTSGRVPYMGHSTFPTTRPRLSATRKPVVAVRFKGRADTLGTYSPSLMKFPPARKGSVRHPAGAEEFRGRFTVPVTHKEEFLNSAFRIWASLVSLAIIVQVGLASYGAFNAVDKSDDNGTIGKNAVSDGFNAHAALG